jgi:hypothetical protein
MSGAAWTDNFIECEDENSTSTRPKDGVAACIGRRFELRMSASVGGLQKNGWTVGRDGYIGSSSKFREEGSRESGSMSLTTGDIGSNFFGIQSISIEGDNCARGGVRERRVCSITGFIEGQFQKEFSFMGRR